MNTKESTAVGVYDDLEKAEHTIEELRHAGFQTDEIGIIGHVQDETVPTPTSMHAPEENAITGVIRGGIIGAVIGALVIVVIPGLGIVSGLGRWFEIVGGAALGSAMGCVLIAFGSFFFSRSMARYYEEELDRGRFIVTVKNPARKAEAVSLLRHQGLRVDQDVG